MNITTEQLFDNARTHNGFTAELIPQATLRQLYDLMKWGPTSANCSPARIVFVSTPEGKEKLLAGMSPGNVEKTRSAPVTAIIGMDMAFYDKLPQLFPHADAKPWFVGKQPMIDATAFRNSSLQGGYFIIAARARARLRSDERLRRRKGRRRFLGRHHREDELHRQPRPWRRREAVRPQPAFDVRRSLQARVGPTDA